MGLRVGEDDFYAARVDPASGAGTFAPHIVPTAHKLHGQHILVLVVGRGVLPFIERPVALFVIGIAEFVPVFAQPFVAAIFGLYHGVMFALVDVEHLTAVFGFAHVEHLARTDGPSAMRVILVANGNHFEHVFTADGLVAAFVEDDTRIVAVVDDGVAHHLLALFPAAAVDIFFGISGREHLHESHSVARLDILFPGGDVHPSHEVGVALDHEPVGVVAQPRRNRHAHTRPFVAGALGIALELDYPVVEPYLAVTETGLAESGRRHHFIDHFPVDQQSGGDPVEVTVSPAPQVYVVERGRGREGDGLLGFYGLRLAGERTYLFPLDVVYLHFITDIHRAVVFVAYL